MPSALDVADGEVRELIQRRGPDSFTAPGPVRVLMRDVVADYSEPSLNSALPPIGDPETVVRDVLDRVSWLTVALSGEPPCRSLVVSAQLLYLN